MLDRASYFGPQMCEQAVRAMSGFLRILELSKQSELQDVVGRAYNCGNCMDMHWGY